MDTIPEPFSLCNALPNKRSSRQGFRVPFGARDGRVWAPGEVTRGKACGCICPGCLAPLAAKALTSRRRRPHFAHLNNAGCQTGSETGIHLRAKQVIQDRRELLLPAWTGDLVDMPNPPQGRDDDGKVHEGRQVIFPATRMDLRDVEGERSLGTYKPDIYAWDGVGEILVEIRVTHAVGDKKAERVQAHGRRMVEIDLSALDRSIPHDPDAFEQAVLFDPSNRIWISCPEAVADWKASKADLDRQISERNAFLAERRDRAGQVARKRQELEETEVKDKCARREFVRKIERAKHADDLTQLLGLASPERISRVLREYQVSARARVGQLLESVSPAVRSACQNWHADAWIFGVDPVLWQLLCYAHFIGKRRPGDRFNQRDVAKWVRQTFPYDKALYRLFVTQYTKRNEARRAGYEKRSIDFWAFTGEENARIPDFYKPVNALIDRLVYAQLVRKLPAPIGECEVGPARAAAPRHCTKPLSVSCARQLANSNSSLGTR